jgi:hypothetical protein
MPRLPTWSPRFFERAIWLGLVAVSQLGLSKAGNRWRSSLSSGASLDGSWILVRLYWTSVGKRAAQNLKYGTGAKSIPTGCMHVCVMGNLCPTDTDVDIASGGALAVEQAVAADDPAAGTLV